MRKIGVVDQIIKGIIIFNLFSTIISFDSFSRREECVCN